MKQQLVVAFPEFDLSYQLLKISKNEVKYKDMFFFFLNPSGSESVYSGRTNQ